MSDQDEPVSSPDDPEPARNGSGDTDPGLTGEQPPAADREVIDRDAVDGDVGDREAAVHDAIAALFATALSDEPASSVSPLAIVAAAKRAAAVADRAAATQRWRRIGRSLLTAAAVAAVGAGAVLGVRALVSGSSSTAGSDNSASSAQSNDGAGVGTASMAGSGLAVPQAAAPTDEKSVATADNGFASGGSANSVGSAGSADGAGAGQQPGSMSAGASSSGASAAQASPPTDTRSAGATGSCGVLPDRVLAAVIAQLPPGVGHHPEPVAPGCGPGMSQVRFTGVGAPTVVVYLASQSSLQAGGSVAGGEATRDGTTIRVSVLSPGLTVPSPEDRTLALRIAQAAAAALG